MAHENHPITEYLSRSGRSLTDLASSAGCSRMTLYRLMKGELNATINLLARISAATNGEVSASDLLPRQAAE